MFSFSIGSTPTLFSKFFSPADGAGVMSAIKALPGVSRVLFVDTGVTPELAEAIKTLVSEGIEVVIRDHHRGEGRTPEAAEAIESLLGEQAKIVTRKEAPACALLVQAGEFVGEGVAIVADPDLDGLTAAMKAAGVTYEGLDSDAEVFDVRPRQSADTLTSLGWLACRSLGTLPPFNPKAPERSEQAKAELFNNFVKASQGDADALSWFETKVSAYEAQVEEAKRLLGQVTWPVPGAVALADTRGATRYDLNTLSGGMERAGAQVTAIVKDFGPIAGTPGGHGIQYSLAVARSHQRELDLRDLVPEGMETSPKAGLLSNVAFLLHCSEKVWTETILPALASRLGSSTSE